MARVHPGNLNSRVPDYETSFDHVAEQPRNYDFEKSTSHAASARGCAGGGGRGRGRGRGGGRSEPPRCCYGCGERGHIVRDCPKTDWRGNQNLGNYQSNSNAMESTSGTNKFKSKPVIFVDDSSSKTVDIAPLLAKIKDKERELKLQEEENEGLYLRLNKATKELSSVQTKNEEMVVNMNKLKEDLEKCRNELSSARKKEIEISQMYLEMKNKFEELEEANEAADVEMQKLKVDTEQWRKAAKAIAVVLDGGEVISSKTQELESLVLYYTNRASKRMLQGKMRKAVDDCRIAARLDPSFLKVCLTAGNCHLELGELDDAINNYKKCLESGAICLDRRLAIEASEGLQKAEKVVSYIKQSAELLQQKTSESASKAVEIIREAMSISCYSEKLLEIFRGMKR